MKVLKEQNTVLLEYQARFVNLRRGVTAVGPAPHKLVMLLAVMREFDCGRITENRIVPSDQLLASFRSIWNAVVYTGHKPNFALPFFHLRGEGFWHLYAVSGQEKFLQEQDCISSLGVLRRTIDHATVDGALFELFRDDSCRRVLCRTLLKQL